MLLSSPTLSNLSRASATAPTACTVNIKRCDANEVFDLRQRRCTCDRGYVFVRGSDDELQVDAAAGKCQARDTTMPLLRDQSEALGA